MVSSGTSHDFLAPPKDSGDYLGSLAHYKVLRELGKGGMGYVFLAQDSRLKRDVALKVMNQKIAATPGSRKRFISEARSMAAVHHDNVATIFEVSEHNGTPYMAMELLEGSTLENYREAHGEPDFRLIIAFARDIARGLGAAHAQGIVHRDIKPANIWLDTKTNRIKILDFGLALAQTPVDQLSGRGAVVGTPGYLSPEQARSEPLDDRSDLFSAGVVLYELAAGALPLKSKSVAEQLISILVHPAKPLRERNPDMPQPLADLIHKLMAKEPRDRISTAKDLEAALDIVEEECEKKTEVAQAISQLQLGLEKAVGKKSGAQIDAVQTADPLGDAAPNPFEALPDVLPPAAATSAATQSGVHAAVPAGGSRSGVRPSPGGGQSRASAKPKTQWLGGDHSKLIWIVIGVAAALILILVPLVVYYSASNAIARQQNQPAVIAGPIDPEDSGSPETAPSSTNNTPPTPPNPTASARPADPSPSQPLVSIVRPAIPIGARPIESLAGPDSKWILSNNQGNGSFDQTQPTQGQLSIPGWTAQSNGQDAGWDASAGSDNSTVAYAGKRSELVITSEPRNYIAKAGDTFRIAADIGGQGKGVTDYQIVVGFRNSQGQDTRYEVAKFDSDQNWNQGKGNRLSFEFTPDASIAGKRPFVEISISNLARTRRRAMVDRVALAVRASKQIAATPSDNRPPSAGDPNNAGDPMSSSGSSRNPSQSNPEDDSSAVLQSITIATSEQNGADVTVSRGSSSNNPLGEKPTLIIQTRNGRQLQHTYLRFPLGAVRSMVGGDQQNNNRRGGSGRGKGKLPVIEAELKLQVISAQPAEGATVRVYGFNDSVSDVWPEDRLVWGNSLSSKGLDSLPLLAEEKINTGQTEVILTGPLLTDLIANAGQKTITLILAGARGTEMVSFASKENAEKSGPELALGLGT